MITVRGTLLAALCIGTGSACTRAQSGKGADSAATAQSDSSPSSSAAPSVSSSLDSTGRARGATTDSTRVDSTSTPTPTPSETVLTGKVVAGGLASEPQTYLQIEGGKATTLVGPLELELRRLGGATVWVAGEPRPGQPNASFAVTRYDVVSIAGAKPLVGLVSVRNDATWLVADRDTVKLVSAPTALAGKAGAKIWVVGRRSRNELVLQSYGVIRDP